MKHGCCAHRGWSSEAPENTLAAIRLTLAHPEITMIELDVQLSKDGIPVVIHDFTLSRTTTGIGLVTEKTLQELKKLDAGSWFSPLFLGEQIPTLAEVMQLVKGKKRLNIELKYTGGEPSQIAQAVIDVIRSYQMEDAVILTSFYHPLLIEIISLAPDIKVGPIMEGMMLSLNDQLQLMRATVLSLHYPYAIAPVIYPLLDHGIEIIAWTVNEIVDMQLLQALDARITICTNYPDRWMQINQPPTNSQLQYY